MSGRPINTIHALRASACMLFGKSGYLGSRGWFRTLLTRSSVDERGEPIPWITYPCLRFLESRLTRDMCLFEFGAGSSTLWWSKAVRRVVSCEHDRAWFDQIRSRIPANVELVHASREDHQYSNKVLEYVNEFDIVVIDGRDRVRCAQNAINALKPSGVIVWDNADRAEYQPGFEFLAGHGYRRIDFFGMAPIEQYEISTAVLYRDDNCLGL